MLSKIIVKTVAKTVLKKSGRKHSSTTVFKNSRQTVFESSQQKQMSTVSKDKLWCTVGCLKKHDKSCKFFQIPNFVPRAKLSNAKDQICWTSFGNLPHFLRFALKTAKLTL